VFIISGAGGGGAPAIFIGGGGGGGSRPKITVPPIPPAGSSLAISMPLDAYQAISTQQQEALADDSALLVQRCMAARGFEDTSSASPPFSTVVTLEQVETAGAGLTSITQARVFGFVHPKNTGSQPSGPQIIGIEGRHWRSPPNKAEIATAVADVTCKTQTNLLNTWLAVEAAYQQALIGRDLAALSQLQTSFAPMLRRANAALAAPALSAGTSS
jgi:hypothetical protein